MFKTVQWCFSPFQVVTLSGGGYLIAPLADMGKERSFYKLIEV